MVCEGNKKISFKLKTNLKFCWQTVKTAVVDYAGHSAIHGVSYIVEKDRSWLEKVWWITVLCLSVFFCGKLIHDDWNISPSSSVLQINQRLYGRSHFQPSLYAPEHLRELIASTLQSWFYNR
jgi:Amiloride-sensitive sodium channel